MDKRGNSDSVRDLLIKRDATHGSWFRQSTDAQKIKAVLRECGAWDALHPSCKEALESIATKQSRLLNGNPWDRDHWLDIAGYAMLIVDLIDTV